MAVGERIVSGDKTDDRGACPFEVAHTPGHLRNNETYFRDAAHEVYS